MKKFLILMLVSTFTFSMIGSVYASDWGNAGKALTIIEGLRVISGGKVDVIGSVTGINKRKEGQYAHNNRHKGYPDKYCSTRIWVSNHVWKRKYVPRHEEYNGRYGKIIVEGHYIKYRVERGGHWENKHYCG